MQQATTTEQNLADVMRFLGVEYEPIVLADATATREAYDTGRCDGFTTDKSGLVRLYHPGKITYEELKARIEPLL